MLYQVHMDMTLSQTQQHHRDQGGQLAVAMRMASDQQKNACVWWMAETK
jgi:hypothetical protein